MDEKDKNLGFGDFLVTKYGYEDDHTEYRRKRLKNGAMHEEVEQVDEVISRSERLKRGQRMKRMSKRIQMAKKRALKRAPTMDVIQNRARKQAKNQMVQKWTRGADKSELSMGRRQELEKRLKKMGPKIDRMAKKLVPTIRKQDRERRSGSKGEK